MVTFSDTLIALSRRYAQEIFFVNRPCGVFSQKKRAEDFGMVWGLITAGERSVRLFHDPVENEL